MDRLGRHVALLEKWNRRINLVSRESLRAVWHRHIADSAQLWSLRPPHATLWLDIGSGAGFPGLVIAALAAADAPELHVRLVESDTRKAAFLDTVIRDAHLPASVLSARIETLPPQAADIVSARALAPLDALLATAKIHRRADGIGLFPKGRTVHKELADAARAWRFTSRIHPSLTDPTAAIVEIGGFDRA